MPSSEAAPSPAQQDRIGGCLLGGAVGDALGAPVEFLSRQQIVDFFGPSGITDFAPAYGRTGAITDDTQMTLFTAEGLIRARVRYEITGSCHIPSVVWQAQQRWLVTQDSQSGQDLETPDGWLLDVEDLWRRRAPGGTCLSSLQGGKMGSIEEPINRSKGCGAVMRVAPAGLLSDEPSSAFKLGAELGALTHGHPTGCLAAGFLAALVCCILEGAEIGNAIGPAVEILITHDGHEETLEAIHCASKLANARGPQADPAELGEGWVADEALAIALFCALTASDFADGIIRFANHGGDSDSTAAFLGNILGARIGRHGIPKTWLNGLELRSVVEQVAEDLWAVAAQTDRNGLADSFLDRYPGH